MSDSNEYAGFVAPEAADLAPLFPGYDIQSLIATGGMGAVYCAVQKSLDRTVALKILPMELSQDATFCAGFEAEAKAMARLNHPNLIGVYDSGEVNGMLYIIMEFVPGKSIYHSADGVAIDPAEVIRLVTGICHGLAHAHEHGIIHRDIKPSNILLDLHAEPKIGDFGLARPIDRQVEEGEEIFGTPHYTAPEVVESPQSVDSRADIFSVGVLLHELLTGKLPADDPRPPSLISHCDVRFDAIVRKATQPSPAARYASAAEIAKDLQAVSQSLASRGPRTGGMGTAAPRTVVPRRSYAAMRKKKSSGASSVILFIFALAAGAAAYYHFSKKPPTTTPIIVVPAPAPSTQETPVQPLPAEPDPVDPAPIVQQPVGTPEPAIVDEAPMPVVKPETPSRTEPIVESNPTAPKYDVPAFFERARKIMQDRADPLIENHTTKLKNNVTSLRRDLERAIRKYGFYRDTSETYMAEYEAQWKKEGYRIPSAFGGPMASVPGASKIFSEHLENQGEIDATLKNELTELSNTYILGMNKQIERLQADNDTGAIDLIEREIQRTKDTPEYFPKLMLGSSATQRD